MRITREEMEHVLADCDWGVDEDAAILIDILLQTFTLESVATWIFFYNTELHAVPLFLLEQGHYRDVFREARRLVGQKVS